ncbi:MAG TPA: CBS domain-containing protein [Bdellovibrionota bacterium]|nr:CBS domain-containing protein [Bdellovibrionota bacterium]
MSTSIEPFIHTKIVVLRSETSAQQAARVMCERAIGCVVVADNEGEISGILTDRDLTCNLLANPGDLDVPIGEIMTRTLITADESADLEQVIRIMDREGIRRIPVIRNMRGGRQKCVGLITLDDLIASEMVDISSLGRIVRKQLVRRGLRMVERRGIEAVWSRSAAHMDQSYHHFMNAMAEKTSLEKELCTQITRFVLGCLVQRIHYSGAAHLMAQLPRRLQEDLFSLPPGPDRSITVSSLVNETMIRFQMDEPMAYSVLLRVLSALGQILDPGQLEHVKAQLPEEFREIFPKSEKAQKPAA